MQKTQAQRDHEAAILAEIKNLPGRAAIEARLDREDNTTAKLVIWRYLQTL